MPRGNRTGPTGMGPMTGRATGYCAGFGVPGYENPVPGRGRGQGLGRDRGTSGPGNGGGGRGRRNMFHATGVPGWMRFCGNAAPAGYAATHQEANLETEKQLLKNQAGALQAELNSIKHRLDDIENEASAE